MSEFIVEILEDILGDIRKHNEHSGQISFDCPACSMEKGVAYDGKGNLEVNYNKNVYKCWSCYQVNDTHGPISKLIKTYGTKDDYNKFKLLYTNVDYNKPIEPKIHEVITGLPKGYKNLSTPQDEWQYDKAINYLKNRGLTDEYIKKYKLGYASEGDYMGRIIVPSFDEKGDVNYYLGRSFTTSKLKYKNPDIPKTEIIFNEGLIKWDSTIYLVEGTFDHMVVPNSIPMLGKVLTDKLYYKIFERANAKVVVCLDPDAWDDAIKIYKRLNSGRLREKIRVVRLPDNYDISDIHKKLGKKGVLNIIKMAKKLKEHLM
jgi:DNA primase